MPSHSKTQYHVCVSPVGWSDPLAIAAYARRITGGAAHRSIAAAVLADMRIQRRCQRHNGPRTFVPTKILATSDGGRNYRHLTEDEQEALIYAEYALAS